MRRSSGVFLGVSVFVAALVAGSASYAAGPTDLPPRFTAKGTVSLVEEKIPAKVFYDSRDGYLRLELDAQPEKAYLIVDPSPGHGGVYFFTAGRCHRSPLPEAAPPSVSKVSEIGSDGVVAVIKQPGDSLQLILGEGVPHFVIEAGPFLLVVRLDEITPAQEIARSVAPPQPCTGSEDFGGKLSAPGASAGTTQNEKVDSGAWIQANGKFASRDVKYVDPSFRSTKSEYDGQLAKCRLDSKCRAYFNIFDPKFGWHCGPGWGEGQTYWLDPLDAVCRYHDGQRWGRSEKEGWCGMWSALLCWQQSGFMTWSHYFPDSFEAYHAIRLTVNTLAFFNGCVTPTCL